VVAVEARGSELEMSGQQVNRGSGWVMLGLSLFALTLVLIGLSQPHQPPPRDEGALAHLFQLSIVGLMPITVLYVATTDWSRPLRSLRLLLISGVALTLAFVLLYRLEHP
jgi:drug/metabolite transporter (DMT)-like permease